MWYIMFNWTDILYVSTITAMIELCVRLYLWVFVCVKYVLLSEWEFSQVMYVKKKKKKKHKSYQTVLKTSFHYCWCNNLKK